MLHTFRVFCAKVCLLPRACHSCAPVPSRLNHLYAGGCAVPLACVNWYGAHMELFSVDGLHN